MLLLLLLPILVAGYIIISKHPRHRYRLHRYDGQLLYLSSAYQGLICTIVGALVVFLVGYYVPTRVWVGSFSVSLNISGWLTELFSPAQNATGLVWILLVSLASIAFAFCRIGNFHLQSFVKYKLWSKTNKTNLDHRTISEMYLMSEILSDSPLDALLYESYVSRKPEKFLMLTMEDGKVYVGKVISLGEPNEMEGMDQEIAIAPFVSGYRKKPTLKVHFTTRYSELDENIQLVLRQDKILSATEFKTTIYEAFQQQRPQEITHESVARQRLKRAIARQRRVPT